MRGLTVKELFRDHVRSLFNINGYRLPELTNEQQLEFVRDPVRYFMAADKPQSDAIWREVLKRQRGYQLAVKEYTNAE